MLTRTPGRLLDRQPLKVVFYGDSISEVKPGWSGGASSPASNWGALLVKRLAALYGVEVQGFHFGIGGQNTYEGLGRLDGMAAFEPDLVFAAFGANDCAYHFLQPEETELALYTLLTEIRRRFGADVMAVGTAGDNPEKPFFRHLEETLAAQRRAAEKAEAPFVDMRAAVLEATGNGARWADYFIHKGNCHPTDPGHAVWAETALTALRAALEEGNR